MYIRKMRFQSQTVNSFEDSTDVSTGTIAVAMPLQVWLRILLSRFVFYMAVFFLSAHLANHVASAQAFPNDNDGWLDVGEVAGFPADPENATGSLDLSQRRIRDLDGANLLTNLNSLDLSWNLIRRVESDDFNGMSKLNELDLRGNKITKIEAGDFQGLTGLQELVLRDNSISRLAAGSFAGMPNLDSLSLSVNLLASIEPEFFSGLEDLQGLSLGYNRITTLNSEDFAALPKLKYLGLNNNSISRIHVGDLDGFSSLELLLLDTNSLSTIEPGTFDRLSSLRTLNLASNNIRDIEREDFRGLTNLTRLELQRNSLRRIDKGDFDELPNLQTLNLGSNAIESVEPGAFSSLKNLTELRLSSPPLEPGVFAELQQLESLRIVPNDDMAVLNLAGSAFDHLKPGRSYPLSTIFEGFVVLGARDITSLVLDDAQLSRGSFESIVGASNWPSVEDVSLVGLTFTDEIPSGFDNLLSIPRLGRVRIDSSLYNAFKPEFDAFAAAPGKSITIVPEPSSMPLLLFICMAGYCRARLERRRGH